ncbi:MAG: accessory factor UbiK family protein [Parvibaculum sp.]|uniref:accessory factor UbiK family protein n=1 Tax=Parvibaculum sp. TaxID=2024848 RepID=UPI0028425301|nr:accessory factor UbiK family protein [Parvibaculum sp.]MDR3499668.1 accessory factor UbiK family protein [Parvibaculum sp.]
MTQTQNRVLDEIARMFTNAAGAAQGVRQEVETLVRSQAERLVADLNLVPREEFEVVRAMASLAREENEALKARIEALEAQLAKKPRAAKAASGEGEPA